MSRHALPLAAIVILAIVAPAQAGLLLYYDFESDSGTTINNLGSLGTDGTLSGPDATAAGPAGGFTPTTARTFNGSSTRIDTNITAVAMEVHQNPNYTMAAWLRPLSNSGDRFVFGQPTSSGWLHNGTRGNQYYQGHYGNDIGGGSVNAIPLGDWRHVTWRYQDGVQQIFVNGATVAGPAARGQLNNTSNILIGDTSTGARYFRGDLDDVVIYQEALTDGQIQYLAGGGDPANVPSDPPLPSLTWDFWPASLEGWTVLNGGAHFRSGDGGGMTPANSTGGFAHDGAHETMLVESPAFIFTGHTLSALDPTALAVEFAGGAGDQNGYGQIYNTPADVLAANGGNSFTTGQKGLAFYNMTTGQYDATIFENDNGGTNVRRFTVADLVGMGVNLGQNYRLHYFENDQGGWGWGQVNWIQIAAVVPEPGTLLIWSLLAGLGVAAGWRRRKKH